MSPRFIVRSQSPEHDVEEYARKHGWSKVLDVAEDPASGEIRSIEWAMTGGAVLKFFEDDATRCSYFFIEAEYSNLCLSMTRHAVHEITVYSRDELLRAFDASPSHTEERRKALLMVALGAPHEFDADVCHRINIAIHDQEPRTRSAAIYAMSYSPSSEYLPALRETAERDSDDHVRGDAQEMLDVFGQVGIADS
ncbi:HEAT repeat domain-containing protein [Streptomyces sp. HC44]|uniref:HEAT repeat domain-containing protein n=1 Tax=Streptomyces scabichelini TaxID=2711217 RepID=A0A6G4VHW9_9ACTN|nr:HEAT repeat domain-containing protein [Streptomyces scabichelini]NGO13561.1 HEAT repeat domain-containing protein [Streptomyces scabichelini]